jgi:hypothetical protein
MKALARDKDQRFASAHEMMVALEQALPGAVTANAEQNTEVFLRRLFEKRIAERHEALQAALKSAMAGSTTPPSGIGPIFPRSQSTMRAVSVEAGVDLISGMSASDSLLDPQIASLSRPKHGRRLVLALAAALAVAVGFISLREGRVSERPGAALSPVPPAMTATASAAIERPIVGAPSDSEAREAGKVPPLDEGRTPGEVGSGAGSVQKVPSTELPLSPKKRQTAPRRDGAQGASEGATSAVRAPPPPPATEPAPSEVDPLNRRR